MTSEPIHRSGSCIRHSDQLSLRMSSLPPRYAFSSAREELVSRGMCLASLSVINISQQSYSTDNLVNTMMVYSINTGEP